MPQINPMNWILIILTLMMILIMIKNTKTSLNTHEAKKTKMKKNFKVKLW